MNIKCGNCHGYHESVAEVRECCASGPKKIPVPQEAFDALRVNRFAGPCKLCGAVVNYGAGHIEKVNGKWTVFHNSGDCVSRPSSQHKHSGDPAWESADGDPEGYGDPPKAKAVVMPDVPEGHYAIKSLTGNNDLTFVRVDKPLQGTWAGATFLKEIVGGHPDSRVRGVKRIRNILQAILDSGPESAALLYAQELGRCSRCNRHLTDELSRAYGMGPECRSKLLWQGQVPHQQVMLLNTTASIGCVVKQLAIHALSVLSWVRNLLLVTGPKYMELTVPILGQITFLSVVRIT